MNTATAKITTIEAFIAKNFNHNCTDYIKLEAKFFNSFLNRLVNAGYNIIAAYDGEDLHHIEENDRFEALDVLFSVDESSIRLEAPNKERFTLYIALGNGDATPIYDYTDMSDEVDDFVFKTWGESVRTHSPELADLNW